MLTDWFEVLDPRFTAFVLENDHVEKLWSGARWTEGPAYVPAGRYLLFSDIPNDRVMRFDEQTSEVTVFSDRCGFQNGRTWDRAGRMESYEHGGRRVSRTKHDATLWRGLLRRQDV